MIKFHGNVMISIKYNYLVITSNKCTIVKKASHNCSDSLREKQLTGRHFDGENSLRLTRQIYMT